MIRYAAFSDFDSNFGGSDSASGSVGILHSSHRNADFVIKATEKYGSRGHEQAERLIKEVSGLYAGGELAEEDMDAMMKAIQEAYWIAKEKNRKFVPKKYRSTSDSNSDS